MLLDVRAAPLHLDLHDGFPDEIGKGDAAAGLGGFGDVEFGGVAPASFRLAWPKA